MSGLNNTPDLNPHFENHIVRYQQNPGATTTNQIGTSTGLVISGTASLLSDATGQYINYASAASANSIMALDVQFVDISGNRKPIWSTIIKTGAGVNDLTNLRLWFGIFSSSPDGVDTLGAIQGAAFRYATGVDGTAFWRTVTSDGSAATTTTTTVAVTLNTRYVFRVDFSNPAQVVFYINDIPVATHTTNLPAAATGLGWTCGGETTNATAKNFRWRRTAFEMN